MPTEGRDSSSPVLVPFLPIPLRAPTPDPGVGSAPQDSREVEVDMKGWWCVRYGDSLAWVEAPSVFSLLGSSGYVYARSEALRPIREQILNPGEDTALSLVRGPPSSTCVRPTASPSTGVRRRRSSASSPGARARRSSPSPAWCLLPPGPVQLPYLRVGTMRSRSTATMGTGGLPARRHAGTELLRCLGRTRRTGTCGMAMGIGSCASSAPSFSLATVVDAYFVMDRCVLAHAIRRFVPVIRARQFDSPGTIPCGSVFA